MLHIRPTVKFGGFSLLGLLWSCAPTATNGYAQAGKTAPDWKLTTTVGQPLSMQSLRGKPVYLNFYATWCPPCREEAPSINKLQEQYAATGLQVVGVDELESKAKAESFRTQYHLVYPAVVDSGVLRSAYRVNGLPVHVFIGRDGVIKKIVEGEMTAPKIAQAVRSIIAP